MTKQIKKTLLLTHYSNKKKEDYLTNVQLLHIYPQSKAEYRLVNSDFIKICLYSRWKSFYCSIRLGRQFLALQTISISSSKKSWSFYKKCFSKKTEVIVEKDLEKLGFI